MVWSSRDISTFTGMHDFQDIHMISPGSSLLARKRMGDSRRKIKGEFHLSHHYATLESFSTRVVAFGAVGVFLSSILVLLSSVSLLWGRRTTSPALRTTACVALGWATLHLRLDVWSVPGYGHVNPPRCARNFRPLEERERNVGRMEHSLT